MEMAVVRTAVEQLSTGGNIEEYAPVWYTEQHHQRTLTAWRILQKPSPPHSQGRSLPTLAKESASRSVLARLPAQGADLLRAAAGLRNSSKFRTGQCTSGRPSVSRPASPKSELG